MERTRMCPDCRGSGAQSVYEYQEIFLWMPRCFTCDGRCILEGNAIVHVRGAGSDLVTEDYIWKFFHIARCFLDGWREYQERHGERHVIRSPRYHEIRAYLSGFDADWVTACQIALYLDPYLGDPWSLYKKDRANRPFDFFTAVV